MTQETRLAELIATRLCHDLTGPVGAVNNGAEFLEEEGFDMQNEAVKLIVSSAHEAVHRLQFYRQAYGRVGDMGEASLSDKKAITRDLFSSTRILLDWPDSHADASGVAVSQKLSRLLLNIIIIVSGSAIRGGTLSVRVTQTPEGQKQFDVSVVGETIRLPAEAEAILQGRFDAAQLSPKTVQPYLTKLLAEELRATVSVTTTADSLSIRAVQSALS